jgi:tetratricopeptide (TPR) repeat protein
MLNKFPIIFLLSFLVIGVSATPELTGEDLFDIGNNHYVNGSLNQAIDSWMQAINLDPTLAANGWYNIGLAYAGLKDYKNAIVAWNNTLTYVPNSSKAYDNIGTAYSILGQYEEAGMAYDMAIYNDPDVVKYKIDKELLLKSMNDKKKTPLSSIEVIISLMAGAGIVYMRKRSS